MLFGKITPKPLNKSARLEHERLTSLINSTADGVIAVDKQARVVIYNGASLNILDRNDSIEGKSIGEIFHPLDKDNTQIDIVTFVTSARMPTSSRDLRIRYADSSIINLYTSI